jgi:hypothetical protein
MATLTAAQRNLLKQTSGEPLRLVDPETQQEYVLLPVALHEQLRSFLPDLDPRAFHPALERALRDEGWDSPQLDAYNHLN